MLDLPAVDLPPPATGGGASGSSLALRALLSVALLVGVFVLAVVIVAALLGVDVLMLQAGRVNLFLLVLPFIVMYSLGRALWQAMRRPPDPLDEVEVPEHDEPGLHEELRRLAAAAGTRPPDRVVVVQEVNAYVREFGPMLGLLPGTRTLAIGTPLLDVLDVSELRAVLAHELGHLAGGDTRLGPLAYRTDMVLARTIESLRGRAVASIFVAYWRFQHRVSAAVRRGQEVVADRAAVRVSGRQATADALRDVEVAAHAEALFREAYLVPLLRSGHRPDDVAAGWRALLAEPSQVAALAAAVAADTSPIDPWASHPPTHERIRRVAAIADEAPVQHDRRPASALFADPRRWVQLATERWYEVVGVDPACPVVPWSSWGDVVAEPEQAARAELVDRSLASLGLAPGLDGVLAALDDGRDRELAASLVARGWRASGSDQARTVLRVALLAVAARAAAAGGARWTTSWSEPVGLKTSTGDPLDLVPLVEATLDGDRHLLTNALPTPLHESPDVAERAIRRRGTPLRRPSEAAASAQATPAQPSAPLPAPPTPPFAQAEPPLRWGVKLPGRIGSKVSLAVSDDHVALDDDLIAFADIEHVSTKVVDLNSTLTATIAVTRRDQTTAKLKASSTGAARSDILAAVGYLWDVLGSQAGPRLRAELAARVRAGEPTVVGGLTLSPAGVAVAKKPKRVVPWAETADPIISGLALHVPTTAKPLSVPLGAEDAYLLHDLLPELRTFYA